MVFSVPHGISPSSQRIFEDLSRAGQVMQRSNEEKIERLQVLRRSILFFKSSQQVMQGTFEQRQRPSQVMQRSFWFFKTCQQIMQR
jgi:hypothetical protein